MHGVPGATKAPTVTYSNGGPGFAHTRSTVGKMAKLAREGSHSYEIRHLATEITRDVPSKAPRLELEALYRWVRDHIRYRYDPLGLEWVQAPYRTVQEGAGDCDDMATLIAALAGALGHPWRFRTVGPTPDVQAHVQVQVFDRTKWLDLDPVIEPTQPTTAPRAELGMFGAQALGAERLWSPEGTMLAGPARRRGRVHVAGYERRYPFLHGWPAELGAPVSVRMASQLGMLGGPVSGAQAADLWRWSAYYQPVSPANQFAVQAIEPGAYPTPDVRYRSANAPGFMNSEPITLYFSLPQNVIPSGQLDGLGWYSEPIQHATLGWGFLKKVAKIAKKGTELVRKVTKSAPFQAFESIMEKVPVVGTFVQLHREFVDPMIQAALDASNAKGKGGAVKALAKGAAGVALKAGTKAAGGKAIALVKPAAKALAVVKKPAAKALAVVKKPAAALAVVKPAAKAAAFTKPANAKLRAKYPANARMLYDRKLARFRVYVPSAHLSGLGALRPTFTISLGAALATQPIATVKTKAATAINAIKIFAAKNKKPPAVSLPAVLAFQVAEGMLSTDGLYGSNTETALRFYQPELAKALPAPAPALRGKVSWQPPKPVLVAPKPAPKPAPVVKPKPGAPVVVVAPKPAQPAQPAPAGYTEVGQEAENPGLPPIGYETHTGGATGTQPKPIIGTPTQDPGTTYGPKPANPRDQTKKIDTIKDPIVVTGPGVSDPDDVGPVINYPPLPVVRQDPPPIPTGPAPHWVKTVEQKSDDNDWLLWAVIGYLWWRQNHRRAA